MKKTYIEPSVKAVEIKITAILAGSIGMNENPSSNPTPGKTLSLDLEFDEEEEEEY